MIREIKSWDEVSTYSQCEFITPNGNSFILERVNNDYYGNPMYHLILLDNDDFNKLCSIKSSERMGRLYQNKGFLTFQSYNTGYELERLFKKCDIETGLQSHQLTLKK